MPGIMRNEPLATPDQLIQSAHVQLCTSAHAIQVHYRRSPLQCQLNLRATTAQLHVCTNAHIARLQSITIYQANAKARHDARPVASRTNPAAISCRNRPSAARGVTWMALARDSAVTTGARSTASRASGSRERAVAAQIQALFLGLEQPRQLAQASLRRGRHAFEKLRHPVEADVQAQPVMILLGR